MKRGPITSHVLDTQLGKPGIGIRVTLERASGDGDGRYELIGEAITDSDGRIFNFSNEDWRLIRGDYRATFWLEEYFANQSQGAYFFRKVPIEFMVDDVNQHYHIPLLLSPFGYTTYRGS